MADEHQQQTLMVSQDTTISDGFSQIGNLHDVLTEKNLKVVTSSDILQQALEEASDYTQSSTYSNSQNSVLQESIQHLSDHSYIHSSNCSSDIIPSCDIDSQAANSAASSLKHEDDNSKDLPLTPLPLETNTSVSNINTLQISETQSFAEDSHKISVNGDVLSFNTISDGNINVFTDSFTSDNTVKTESTFRTSTSITECPVTETLNAQFSIRNKDPTLESTIPSCTDLECPVTETLNPQFSIRNKDPTTLESTTPSCTGLDISSLKLPAKRTNEPLGSVKNPIQLIQNGNSYHSTQVLTQAQLQQIAHVLQKQQAQKMLTNKGKSVLYDPSTNTRIVCRIVHPAELQPKTTEVEPNLEQPSNIAKSRGAANSFRGRGRPRKPPSRKPEEDEKGNPILSKEEREEKKKHRPRTRSGRISKPPSYMVKDYKRIHHLDFNEEPYDDSDGGYSDFQLSDEENDKRGNKSNLPPGVTTAKQRNYSCTSCSKAYIGKGGLFRHYRLNPSHGSMPEGEDVSTQDENSNSSLASSVLSSSGGNTNSQTPNFACQSNTRIESAKTDTDVPPSQSASVTSNVVAAIKRQTKLREVLKRFSDEDIKEVIFPKFAQDISLWDFFVAKCKQKSEGLSIFEMLKEFEQFITQMQRESHSCLKAANLEESQGKTIINISSQQIAAALSLEVGSYEVKTSITAESELQDHLNAFSANETDRMAEDSPSLKRKRIDSPVEDVSSGLPEQILSDVIQGDSLELPLTEHLPSSTELQMQVMHTLSNSDNQHDAVSKALFDLSSSTIVTPSSLSSGCLSAVNASKAHPAALLASTSPSKLQNLQVRKIQLFGTQQQPLLHSTDTSVPIGNLSISAQSDLPSTSQESIVQKSAEMCNNNIMSNMPLDSSIDIFNGSIQDLPTQTVLDSTSESAHIVSSLALINTTDIHNQNVPNFSTQTVSAQTAVSGNAANCLTGSHVSELQNSTNVVNSELQALVPSEVSMSSGVKEEPREFQNTHNVIPEVTKLPETSAVLRHLMLPDGQVISVWSHLENSDKQVMNEQFVQSYVPGNLIILQNPDGSIQVPSNQGVPAETLQTLATLNPGLCSETGTHAFTTVQPM